MEVFKTFDEWKKLGMIVIRGEKSIKRNNEGKCVFSEKQVTNKPIYDHPAGFYDERDELTWEDELVEMDRYDMEFYIDLIYNLIK